MAVRTAADLDLQLEEADASTSDRATRSAAH